MGFCPANEYATVMIKVHNLRKSFGAVQAVRNISFEVRAGELFGFLGPNGAGKTTTIKMLTTLLAPTSGSIRVDGLDPVTDPKAVRHRIGIVFQDNSLDTDLTAYENLELHAVLFGVPKRVFAERARVLLERFELWDRRRQPSKNLSGGLQRRLEIARALLHAPRILFLDEPTVGLDPQSRHQLWTQVRSLNQTQGMTVFLTTHQMEEAAQLVQRIVVIDHGSIVAQGSPAELMRQTRCQSLEQAFLALTGAAVRDEEMSSTEAMREFTRVWK